MTVKIIDIDTIEKMNLSNFDKIVKWVRIGVEAAFLVVFVILCIAVGAKNHKIKEYKEALKFQCEVTDSLQRTVNDLWGQECIRIENHIEVVQKGIVNTTAANNISRSVSEITRGELLMAMDSLKRVNNEK